MSYTRHTAHGTTTIIASRSTPRWHTAHTDGTMSIEVSGFPTTVFLNGTRAEIADWARNVRAAAIEGDED